MKSNVYITGQPAPSDQVARLDVAGCLLIGSCLEPLSSRKLSGEPDFFL